MYETWLIIPRTAGYRLTQQYGAYGEDQDHAKVALCFGKRAIELRT